MKSPDIPVPLRSFLSIDCNATVGEMGAALAGLRSDEGSEYWQALREQLQDPKTLAQISDPLVFERLTDIGFEDKDSVLIWLSRVWEHVYADGPYPISSDLD